MGFITALFDSGETKMIEEAFRASDCTTIAMKRAIQEWFGLYFSDPVNPEKEDPCMQIPLTVINKLQKAVFGEYSATSKDSFAQTILPRLNKSRKRAFQMAMIGGLAYIKPFPTPDGFSFSVVNRNNILIFGKDANGIPTDVGSWERTISDRHYYTLLERRTVSMDGKLTIQYSLYRSESKEVLGTPARLAELPKYEALQPEYTYPRPLSSPLGMVPMMTPLENNVDGSDDPVSVYSAAVGLIHNINRNEAEINGEFERGKSRIIASADMLRKDSSGRRHFDDDIFVGLDDDPDKVGVTIFSPELREQSFLARKQDYLRAVETVVGMKRGLISEVEAEERTATEITSSAGEYNLTIIDLQEIWENAVKATVKLCGELGVLYRVKDAHEITDDDAVSIDWGNGILFDEDKTWANYMAMVSAGLLKPEIAVGWRFGMPTETPEDLQKVREKYMPEAEVTEEEDDADE